MAPFFYIEKFIDYIKIEKRYSSHTCLAYKKDIEQFILFSGINNESDLTNFDYNDIRNWVVELLSSSFSKRSVNRKLSSIRTYFSWLNKEKIILTNPAKSINGPKMDKRIPNFARISEMSISTINEFFDNDSFEAIRNRLIIEIFYQTGIRLNELINLKINDIESDRIKVLGKSNKERIIPISNDLFSLINSYTDKLKGIERNHDYFFVRNNGMKIYSKLVYRIINSYLSNVTDLDKCSPHVLRHTFATHMLNNGSGLEVLKDILGHSSLTATEVYTHNSFTSIKNIYSQAHPRGHKKK